MHDLVFIHEMFGVAINGASSGYEHNSGTNVLRYVSMQNVNENILSFTAEHPPPQAVEVIGPYKKVSGNPC